MYVDDGSLSWHLSAFQQILQAVGRSRTVEAFMTEKELTGYTDEKHDNVFFWLSDGRPYYCMLFVWLYG